MAVKIILLRCNQMSVARRELLLVHLYATKLYFEVEFFNEFIMFVYYYTYFNEALLCVSRIRLYFCVEPKMSCR